jgi:hypothetical protein
MQRIGDAVDVIEVADDLGSVVNGTIIQIMLAQGVEINGRHLVRCSRQLFGVSAQGCVYRAQWRLPPIRSQQMYQTIRFGLVRYTPIVGDLSPEVVRMSANSVEAMINGRNDHGQHLALAAAERRTAKHDGAVKIHRGFHGARILAHDGNDVPDAPSPFQSSVVLFFEQTSGFF